MFKKIIEIYKRMRSTKMRKIETWELELLKHTLQKLPTQYHRFIKQIDANLLERVGIGYSYLPHWRNFGFNTKIVDKYERKKESGFDLTGIKVFDKKSNTYLNYTIHVGWGLLIGYSIDCDAEFEIDVTNIDTRHFVEKSHDSEDFVKIKKLLSSTELQLINSSDVYAVELEGKIYYHLQDLEDGDFIGIDLEKHVYQITHDPYEIKLLTISLEQALTKGMEEE